MRGDEPKTAERDGSRKCGSLAGMRASSKIEWLSPYTCGGAGVDMSRAAVPQTSTGEGPSPDRRLRRCAARREWIAGSSTLEREALSALGRLVPPWIWISARPGGRAESD